MSFSEQVKPFLSGGFGGMCLVFAGHPLDLVKVKLQTSNQYKGTVDCFRQVWAKEGIRGIYRGMSTPLVGATPIFAVCFWGYDVGKRFARTIWGTKPDEKLSMAQTCFAGGFSAIPTTLLMAPIERVKVILQTQESSSGPKFKGPVDAGRHILKTGGVQSLFKGTAATLLRDGPASVAYFGAYEVVKKALSPADGNLSILAVLTAGGMAGIANWAVAIPADVVKSRYQGAPEGKYTGIGQVFTELIKTEGPKALFKGLGPAMLRAFPANAACFMGVEVANKFLNSLF